MNVETIRRILRVAQSQGADSLVMVTVGGLSYVCDAVVMIPAEESETGKFEVHFLPSMDDWDARPVTLEPPKPPHGGHPSKN